MWGNISKRLLFPSLASRVWNNRGCDFAHNIAMSIDSIEAVHREQQVGLSMHATFKLFGLSVLACVFAVLSVMPASAKCTRLGFTVNDYGKEGPTNDAKKLLDDYIAKWTSERGITGYKVGKKSVKCELFLDFIVFDEHTCTAEASVCWSEQAAPKKQQDADSGTTKSAKTSPPAVSPEKEAPKAQVQKVKETPQVAPAEQPVQQSVEKSPAAPAAGANPQPVQSNVVKAPAAAPATGATTQPVQGDVVKAAPAAPAMTDGNAQPVQGVVVKAPATAAPASNSAQPAQDAVVKAPATVTPANVVDPQPAQKSVDKAPAAAPAAGEAPQQAQTQTTGEGAPVATGTVTPRRPLQQLRSAPPTPPAQPAGVGGGQQAADDVLPSLSP